MVIFTISFPKDELPFIIKHEVHRETALFYVGEGRYWDKRNSYLTEKDAKDACRQFLIKMRDRTTMVLKKYEDALKEYE